MRSNLNLVSAGTVLGKLNAEVIKSRLEAEGIPVMLKFETYFYLYLADFCPVSIIVPSECYKDVREIIEPEKEIMLYNVPKRNVLLCAIMYFLSNIL